MKNGETGSVVFPLPFDEPPAVRFLSPNYFLVEATTTEFRWRVDGDPGKGSRWVAGGIAPPNLVELKGRVWSTKVGQEGVVAFGTTFTRPPTVRLGWPAYEVVEVTPTQFRWRCREDNFPFVDWAAVGVQSPGAADPPMEQYDRLEAGAANQEGMVRFVAPFADPPTVEVEDGLGCKVIEVTPTDFRWRYAAPNLGRGPSWRARGKAAPEARQQHGLLIGLQVGDTGVVRFDAPYAEPPRVEVGPASPFLVEEVTTRHFRWRYVAENAAACVGWTAWGVRPQPGGARSGSIPNRPGLVAEYFAAPNLTNRVATTVNAECAVNWGLGSPHPKVPADNFSVRWHGWLIPPQKGTYTFYVHVDDGAVVYIDQKPVMGAWTRLGKHYFEVELSETPHPLRIQFREGTGTAMMVFGWSPKPGVDQVVPGDWLFHDEAQSAMLK